MPESAVKRHPETLDRDAAGRSRRHRAADPQRISAAQAGADAEKKLARAARSAERLARLSEGARGGETLDLFAEDAERAQLQAMNTDIRQGTFEGFELPDVFLAAVQSNGGTVPGANQAEATASKRVARGGPTSAAPEAGLFQDDLLRSDITPPENETLPGIRTPENAPSTLIARDRGEPSSRDERAPLAKTNASAAAPEIDRARAAAFADTVDALYAVIAEQRTSTAAHARRMKTMLTIIVCVMLMTVATGIAQTAVLLRMSHDSKLQQDRTEQLMLNQQATLASLFDTDSATFSVRRPPDRVRDPNDDSPIQPVSAARARTDVKAESPQNKHARRASTRAARIIASRPPRADAFAVTFLRQTAVRPHVALLRQPRLEADAAGVPGPSPFSLQRESKVKVEKLQEKCCIALEIGQGKPYNSD